MMLYFSRHNKERERNRSKLGGGRTKRNYLVQVAEPGFEGHTHLINLSFQINNPILVHPQNTPRMGLFAIPYAILEWYWW